MQKTYFGKNSTDFEKTDFGKTDFEKPNLGKKAVGKTDFGKTDFAKTNFGKPDFENLSVHVPIHRKGTVDAIGWDKAGTEFAQLFDAFGSPAQNKKQKILKDGPKDSAADFFSAVCGGTDENDDDVDVFGKATSQGTPGRKGKKTEGAPTDSKGEGYPEVLAQCLNLVNKQLKKASLTLGVAFKGKLSRPAIDELKVVHKGGESLRKALSALAMKKNLEKTRSRLWQGKRSFS